MSHRDITQNYRSLAEHSAPGHCAAVIKADGYGIGALPVATTLAEAGCQSFFVADAREGLLLRQQLPESQIFLFDGVSDGDLAEVVKARLIPVLCCEKQHRLWTHAGGNIIAWQVDSGMNRLGFSLQQALKLATADRPPDWIISHFSSADTPDLPAHQRQLVQLNALRRAFPEAKISLGNTAGIQLSASGSSQMSRCGIGLYGCNPAPKPTVELTGALRLEGRVLQCRQVAEGNSVGYNALWSAKSDSILITVGLGYADGIPRSLAPSTMVWHQDHPLPIVGRISMDYLVVDASALAAGFGPDHIAGIQWLTVFNSAHSLDQLAAQAGTISYELLTRLGPRIERVHEH
ncbi:MAG: alanine racemase [Lysobacterales bacterium]